MGRVSVSAPGGLSTASDAHCGRWQAAPLLVSLVIGWSLLAAGCGPPARRPPAPPAATPDARVSLSTPTVVPRSGAAGAPVDCSAEVLNRSGRAVSRLVLACELLDADGVPVGT